jgi:hypothetical protein
VDEVQTYCIEGTPSWMSKTNSNTNLSSITADDNIKDIHSSRLNESADTSSSSSEDSSLSSDNDELLLQGCIKQAWAAKGKPQFIPKVTIEHFFTYVPSALMPGRRCESMTYPQNIGFGHLLEYHPSIVVI